MAIARQARTVEEFLALPEEEPPLEYREGTVTQKVSPQGRHGRLEFTFALALSRCAEPTKRGLVFTELRSTYEEGSLVPDIAVYLHHRVPRTPDGKIADRFTTPPDIAVEIVSPGQTLREQSEKCRWFAAHGVQITLLLNPNDESVTDFRPGGESRVFRGDDRIDLAPVLPDFDQTVRDVFATLFD